MDDLPNKIRDVLGIMTEVNLREDEGLYFIEIVTPPYSVPISLRGSYYYRSGSTKQELKGIALMEFLLRKSGKTWDDVVELRGALTDIDEKSVERFKSDAARAGRLPAGDGELPLGEFLDKLRLMENGHELHNNCTNCTVVRNLVRGINKQFRDVARKPLRSG